MKEMKTTIFVVDDDPLLCRALKRLLTLAEYGVETFPSAQAFLARDSYSDSGCVLLDVHLPDLDGFGLQDEMKRAGLLLPVIFITGYGDVPMAVKAIKGGATNFLTKPFDNGSLLLAISEAIDVFRHSRMEAAETESKRVLIETLTSREKEILAQVITGKMNKTIASELKIAESTVKVHRGRIMQKLGAQSIAELIRLGEKAGIKPA